MVVNQAPPGPMELIQKILETKRSRSLQNAINLEIGSPSKVPTEKVAIECDTSTGGEEKLRVGIERELGNLAIEKAHIGTAHRRLIADGDSEDGKDLGRANDLNGDQGTSESLEIVGDENRTVGCDVGNEENGRNKSGEVAKKSWKNSQFSKGTKYPVRVDAEDCPFYMRFGSCKFGQSCKFNHPPSRNNNQIFKERPKYRDENSEKAGQSECKFYSTSGGCRNGKNCKYSHCFDNSFASHILEVNLLGFPIRPGENECPYYMRTGSCKYGANCRYHHPEPSAFAGGGPRISRHFPSESSAFRHVSSPQTQSPANSNSEWTAYQAGKYTYESGLPVPPAFSLMDDVAAGICLPLLPQHANLLEEYPERPGEPECNFFMKTGDCKFKYNCKFHHPKNRNSKPKFRPTASSSSSSLNDKGLPLRPDEPICTHYFRYGICKYGPACKYDHSSNMDDEAAEK